MELKLVSEKEQAVGSISVSDALFGREYNEALVHQVIRSYLANARSANRAQKGRSDISKSKRKPWRQKGTGRARVGAASSPIWRGGGKVFPNSPDENFSQKINRKMYRAGICVILSQLARENRISIVDTITVDEPKTKIFSAKLKNLDLDEVMIISNEINENLYLSSRNIPKVLIVEVKHADPVSLLRYKKVLITTEGLKKFEEFLI
ncbi:LSU ribosomal protein L4P [Nitrosomonas cryotolerans]|uniref:Large ribosomal subunit protein uL4 n=1 Tax=Nitrosomonas cryotolerans ATCC 49181 TaxID=1131553 RepID=A0A1N6HJ82_9PROT|nr:50S ribosomal protein L4 [Nitrosomonas cryotolerans]SFP65128.1 LSU ribosomal protein L4P [Nitrosomonas cryotolerans]SIO19787.1 large subunit ribosomal protein L4 [Nitrosomonas cryotolerans ATCC 49181]